MSSLYEEEDTCMSYEEGEPSGGGRYKCPPSMRRRIHACHMRRGMHGLDAGEPAGGGRYKSSYSARSSGAR